MNVCQTRILHNFEFTLVIFEEKTDNECIVFKVLRMNKMKTPALIPIPSFLKWIA
jgi:hypothetical protein